MATPEAVISDLEKMADPGEVDRVSRFFRGDDPDTTVMGIQIGRIFPVAKGYSTLDLGDVESLLADNRYEVRMAAMAILDFKAQKRGLADDERRALFDLYLRRHDRINNWDLVDPAAARVVGDYLIDKDQSVLDRLAASANPHERRTAIVATHAMLKRGETSDTFRIAGLLAGDPDDYVQKAIASWTREAGKTDQHALIRFLEDNLDVLPRSTVTAASKLLPEHVRTRLRP
ncbi:DNA alkylation repair protein [Roseobacter sinensis]|uniref:DNA alkylation repair protein n=1 Tax=Roseobacter sinensis TaxID=2931391 RepID=A0ABT3B8G6_9RHOB|nr:DNA alkylation repair protein [Roseobacter sp. WL0113]MCV3269863.1 DNA alkylation repair protein [Roseobacter sp. WL0113]